MTKAQRDLYAALLVAHNRSCKGHDTAASEDRAVYRVLLEEFDNLPIRVQVAVSDKVNADIELARADALHSSAVEAIRSSWGRGFEEGSLEILNLLLKTKGEEKNG